MKVREKITDNIFTDELSIELWLAGEYSDDDYNDLLDEVYPTVVMGESEFYPSGILRQLDRIAYDTGRCEEEDYLISEFIYELQHASVEDTLYIFGYEFEVIEND